MLCKTEKETDISCISSLFITVTLDNYMIYVEIISNFQDIDNVEIQIRAEIILFSIIQLLKFLNNHIFRSRWYVIIVDYEMYVWI